MMGLSIPFKHVVSFKGSLSTSVHCGHMLLVSSGKIDIHVFHSTKCDMIHTILPSVLRLQSLKNRQNRPIVIVQPIAIMF